MAFLALLLFFLICLIPLLGLSLGLGWLLTLFLPFKLWESALLALLANGIVLHVWLVVNHQTHSVIPIEDEEDEEEEEEESRLLEWAQRLPPLRGAFAASTRVTPETWFLHLLADLVQDDLERAPDLSGGLSERQRQEFALRSAAAAVRILRAKFPQVKQFRATKAALKREMTAHGHGIYEDRLLELAVAAINRGIDAHYDELRAVIRDQSWTISEGTPERR
jgi:hypothetical protein